MNYRSFFCAIALLLGSALHAQSCDYQLILEDLVSEDGWNGGQLMVRVAGVSRTFTLGSGRRESFFFPVATGDAVEVDYRAGVFAEEVSFRLLDNNDTELFAATAPATGTNIFTTTANCVACAPPPASSINFFRVRFNSVDVSLRPNPDFDSPSYRVEYGLNDFDPSVDGEEEVFNSIASDFRIEGLEPNSRYTFWVSSLCTPPGSVLTSERRGPFTIMTQREKDVGITLLANPNTGCDIDGEQLTIGITNFGGAPQSFIRLGYSVNGNSVPINFPNDGIFTGIVNPDSTEFFTFDNPVDLGEPGRYQFEIFTSLEDDEDLTNNVLKLGITNQPVITELPYHENFEESNGLWVVDRSNRSPISWEWGTPQGEVIDRAPQGNKAWVTNLSGDYFNDEASFLISPCFDFTGLDEDPYFSAALIVDTEEDFDDLSLEMSTDNGESWSVVGIGPDDINWYNDRPNQVWEGDGGFGNQTRIVGNTLEGAAGEEIKLRFAFRSSLDDTREGILVDAISISERGATDVTAVAIDRIGNCAMVPGDFGVLTYQNIGTTVVDTVFITTDEPAFSLSDTIVERLSPGMIRTYDFQFTPDGSRPSTQSFEFTVTAPGDANEENDVILLDRQAFEPFPFVENFNNNELPEGYEIQTENTEVATNAASGSPAIISTLAAVGDTASFSTTVYRSLVSEADTLGFNVSIADEDARVKLEVFITDCVGEAEGFLLVDTLDNQDYRFGLTSTLVPLNGPLTMQFRFKLTLLVGEATVGIDDIRVRRCPSNLSVAIDVVPATSRVAADGQATAIPSAGTPPYRYLWSTGATTQTVDDLPLEDYVVTVTDALGCEDVIPVEVRNFVSTEDPQGVLNTLELYPNPTAGALNMQFDLPQLAEVSTVIFNVMGRRLEQQNYGRIKSLNTAIDLAKFAPGIYLIRVEADGAASSVRVIRH